MIYKLNITHYNLSTITFCWSGSHKVNKNEQ